VIAFHGTADQFVPYTGGNVIGRGDSGGSVLSVSETIGLFVTTDGCSTTNRGKLPAHRPADGTTVYREIHAGGRNGTEVVLYIIDNGGHTWPGRPAGVLYGAIAGRTTRSIDASTLIWEFFEKHPKPKL
jgi:polyhydroxybutyrate depolymerase